MSVILIPPKTKAKLTALIAQRDQLQVALNGVTSNLENIVDAMRETMNVPETWRLDNLDAGFVAPPEEPADAPE
jgi:hypothetical protein